MDSLSKLMETAFKQEEFEFKGEKYIVKEMNAGDKAKYENSLYSYKQVGKDIKVTPTLENASTGLVVYTLYDSEGKKMFKGVEDILIVAKLPASFVEKVCKIANKLNGLDKEEVSKNL